VTRSGGAFFESRPPRGAAVEVAPTQESQACLCRFPAPRLWSRALLLIAVCFVQPVYATDIDWTQVERDATELLSAYVQIDTTNPPGNETAAARLLAQRFQEAGIAAEIFESEPGRGSVLARLKGAGGSRPIVLLNHLDVVPANASEWTVPPFTGAVRDGFVYGRGALDCKGVGTVDAMAMLLLKRQGITLRRDVIFMGTAGEETGGQAGAGWMVANHFDKLGDAEFVLNEGGDIHIAADGKATYEVAVAEKTPCWLRLTATGDAGHGSAPPPHTAVTRILDALDRVRRLPQPVHVTPEVQAYYAAHAVTETGGRRAQLRDLRAALKDESFRKTFLGDRHDAALVRNTIAATVLNGSQKTNVIPHSASAELDCRLLPGEDPERFVRTIKDAIADPLVSVEVLLNFPSSSSPTDTALYRSVSQLARREGLLVMPAVLTGFTDSHYFREKGIASYGFVPFALTDEDGSREHGIDERLSTANLRGGIRRLIELLQVLDSEVTEHGQHPAHD
jgi:acetylornithine deacetylase/succinyl-diaminopimelate desuccinylase-like protein